MRASRSTAALPGAPPSPLAKPHRSSAALPGAPPPPAAAKPHRHSAALAALFFALLLLVSIKIHFEHLRIAPDSARTSASSQWRTRLGGLPRGILEPTSDLEMKPLWGNARVKDNRENYTALLAMAVGISQKKNVDLIVRKFLMGNFSVILLHYDGNVDGWNDLGWSDKAIHVSAPNQTKWWFAKRFLHPDVVSMYEYIFLWDEDLGVEHFHPVRYLQIMSSEGLDISQPALDPNKSSDIHHRITVRNQKSKVHRRVFDSRGSLNCSDKSRGPPCTGWVEGMAPVLSRAAWRCAWLLIQNDLIHGWGLDMKLGYCAQGDRTKKVGVIDSEFVVHHGIPTLGRSSADKVPSRSLDLRTRVRRQSTAELSKFKERWNRAVKEDSEWIDPYEDLPKRKGRG